MPTRTEIIEAGARDFNRFWSKVKVTDDCWDWTGYLGEGYGKFWFQKRVQNAHRVSYMWYYGEIPEGLYIDHLCRNRSCVRPNHLEAVTNKENSLRGLNSFQVTGRCRSGRHIISGPDDWFVTSNGRKVCLVCRIHNKKLEYLARSKCVVCGGQYQRKYLRAQHYKRVHPDYTGPLEEVP